MKLHDFRGNPFGKSQEWGVTTKLLTSRQQLILEHLTWYQINLGTYQFSLMVR